MTPQISHPTTANACASGHVLALTFSDEAVALQANRDALLAALHELGVDAATVEYCGGGDEGSVQRIRLSREALSAYDEVQMLLQPVLTWQRRHKSGYRLRPAALGDALEDLAWHFVLRLHEGFWNGDGGEGTVVFLPSTNAVLVSHDDLFYSRERTETRL